jgi:membrane protein implicated in regulation of membrane protease activity
MLSASLSENSTIAAKFVNAFWVAGIFLDVLGAVLATLTTRWLELLDPKETETLNQEWSAERKDLLICEPRWSFSSLRDAAIAAALFSGFPIVACGVSMFLIGLVIYVWAMQPLLVSIISTIPFVVLSPLVAACFYPHSGRKHDILELLARKRGAW